MDRDFNPVVDMSLKKATHIDFCLKKLSREDLETLAQVLRETQTLRILGFEDCEFEGDDFWPVIEALGENTSLQHLTLEQMQQIKDTHVQRIAKVVKSHSSLTRLAIKYIDIGPTGATALATLIETNQTLQRLYLTSASIGDMGTVAIGNAVEKNRTLRVLDLNHNCIENKGGLALASALKKNHTLRHLNINDNRNIGPSVLSEMIKALDQNTTLVNLHFDTYGSKLHFMGSVRDKEMLARTDDEVYPRIDRNLSIYFYRTMMGVCNLSFLEEETKLSKFLRHIALKEGRSKTFFRDVYNMKHRRISTCLENLHRIWRSKSSLLSSIPKEMLREILGQYVLTLPEPWSEELDRSISSSSNFIDDRFTVTTGRNGPQLMLRPSGQGVETTYQRILPGFY